jgi:hypothetical protein
VVFPALTASLDLFGGLIDAVAVALDGIRSDVTLLAASPMAILSHPVGGTHHHWSLSVM